MKRKTCRVKDKHIQKVRGIEITIGAQIYRWDLSRHVCDYSNFAPRQRTEKKLPLIESRHCTRVGMSQEECLNNFIYSLTLTNIYSSISNTFLSSFKVTHLKEISIPPKGIPAPFKTERVKEHCVKRKPLANERQQESISLFSKTSREM